MITQSKKHKIFSKVVASLLIFAYLWVYTFFLEFEQFQGNRGIGILQAEITPVSNSGVMKQQLSGANAPQLINIARPDQHRISDNKYSQFNVDRRGAIFNNNAQQRQVSVSGFDGRLVGKNPNFASSSARLILNRVINAFFSFYFRR